LISVVLLGQLMGGIKSTSTRFPTAAFFNKPAIGVHVPKQLAQHPR